MYLIASFVTRVERASLQLLPEGQDDPEIVHDRLAHFLRQVSMDNLRRPSDVVALVIGGDCADQAFLNNDNAVLSLGGIAVLQPYELRTTRWLATRHVDKEEPLEELVHLVKVRLHRLLLPLKLGFWAPSKHLVPQPVVLKYSVKQPSVAALLKLVCVVLVLKEVPALLLAAVVISEAIGKELWHYIFASFVGKEEKQAFSLLLCLVDIL
jgi:hypothetical protein